MINVLVVEDSSSVRDQLTARLSGIRQIGSLEEAATVGDALRKCRKNMPDVITLDIDLPDGKGLEVLNTIKKAHPQTVVIMLTNHAQPEYRKLSLEAGADFFLDKLSGPNVVYDIVRWLAQRTGKDAG
jgi:two-component system response regulator DevR